MMRGIGNYSQGLFARHTFSPMGAYGRGCVGCGVGQAPPRGIAGWGIGAFIGLGVLGYILWEASKEQKRMRR